MHTSDPSVAPHAEPPSDATASIATTVRLRGIRRSLAALALEILVGFVGVYAAFWLAARHERADLDERRRQVRLALIAEIKDIRRGTGAASKSVGGWVVRYDSALAAGGRPPLQPVLSNQRLDAYMWSATQQSGGLQLLDVPSYVRLASYYNDVSRAFEEIDRLRARSDLILLPNADRGPDEFYSAPGKLRTKYLWYPVGMKQLAFYAKLVHEESDSMIVMLERGAPK